MAIIQSSIELADRAQKRIFVVSIVFGVAAALIAAFLAWLVWNANNKYQDAVKADADARIAESNAEAKRAGESAANALKDAGVANEKAGKANERAGKLEHDNLTLRGQVATLETAAADAKKDVAGLQKAAADAKAAQQRVETELAKQQTRAAEAETKLIAATMEIRNIRERQSRALSESQKQRLVAELNEIAKARWHLGGNTARPEVVIKCWAEEPQTGESCAFAAKLYEFFSVSWSVKIMEEVYELGTSSELTLRSDLSAQSVNIVQRIQRAFQNVGITIVISRAKANAKPEQIELIVGPLSPSR